MEIKYKEAVRGRRTNRKRGRRNKWFFLGGGGGEGVGFVGRRRNMQIDNFKRHVRV